MPIELQARDLALLYYTWQSRFVAQRQYHKRFWPKGSQAAVAKRLIELVGEQLLRTHKMPWRHERVLYSVTLAGTRALSSNGMPGVRVGDFPKRINDFTPGMKHDLDLVDLRIAMEETGHLIWWTSEHELRLDRKQHRRYTRITDGVFDFEASEGQGKGILEYERMGYRRTKFHDILRRLLVSDLHNDGAVVFFVCQDARRAETLRTWALENFSWQYVPNQIYFSHFEAVKAAGLLGGFVNLNGKALVLPKMVDADEGDTP